MGGVATRRREGLDDARPGVRIDVPYLRLVPALAEPDAPAHSREAVREAMQASPGGIAVRHHRSPVRLTRRGKIVVWLLLLAAAMAIASLAPR